ncbi:proton-conducting transporter transmembrane domain-containing protein [Frigoriglobus tundricola]|uniref:NADH-ubiquinone oxidoreductase chain L-like protein, cluster 1 n=1 Tax=Frigoriglobus tundricola TaxID=2774151 RepID=A0A6M5YHN3_9BACT|nr:proton-conducting transporter membrane subunit [Frigoriglobus tundricola]QJW92776.1 NADH-ubiquinone oxidoreductase chain L-like protein, cluster 1 [Frigoriglobus tundricola]
MSDTLPDTIEFMTWVGGVTVTVPFLLLGLLGLPSLLGYRLTEATSARATRWLTFVGLLAACGLFLSMLVSGHRHVVLDLGNWVEIHAHAGAGHEHYHFSAKFVFDRLSIPLVILSYLLCGTIGAFAVKYLHREPGYNRFFVLFGVFLCGMVTASAAGTIETLFTGWELVGLSSALLVAYFQERPAPARNGLRIWAVYRVSDAALLTAAVVMHQMAGEGDFDRLLGSGWPGGAAPTTSDQALLVGLLLLLAAAGKSALLPFSGWLPRAMEGPTPSSAVFYGALSVHLGAFLLLRANALIAASVWLAVAVVALGLLTAAFAYLAGSVQTDIKSALSFASLTQVGLIVIEIGAGHWVPFLWYVALAHLIGHACMRTLQFVRAPSLLQDYRRLENAIGGRLQHRTGFWLGLLPVALRQWVYRFALERGYLDVALDRFVVRPFVAVFQWFDDREWRLTAWLNAAPDPREPGSGAAPCPAPPEPAAAAAARSDV